MNTFIPQLWADHAAKMMARAIDESVLAALLGAQWIECVPIDECPRTKRGRRAPDLCQACVMT